MPAASAWNRSTLPKRESASCDDIPTAIHDARRCLKRLRALLRLIRPALAESTYRREANRIAGIGKLLADARDQHVMQLTLAKIALCFDTFPKSVGAKLTKLMANGGGTRSARAGAQERRQALDGLAHAGSSLRACSGGRSLFDYRLRS